MCYWAVRELGIPMSCLARKLGISIPSVSESVTRGRRIAGEKDLLLIKTEEPNSLPVGSPIAPHIEPHFH